MSYVVVNIGDEIQVNGLYFICAEVGEKIDQPAYVTFKQPSELARKQKMPIVGFGIPEEEQ